MISKLNNSSDISTLPVLIIGYKRYTQIIEIIKACKGFGVVNFFVYLDGLILPETDLSARKKFLNDLAHLASLGYNIRRYVSPTNAGCAVSVMRGVDWALSACEAVVVLEDDCIPSHDFFRFCKDAELQLRSDDDILVLCGSQFAPEEVTHGKAYKSIYALTWGWFTTNSKWNLTLQLMKQSQSQCLIDSLLSLNASLSFWSAGARRAFYGYTDVWDTILLYVMKKYNKYALLPGVPLVKNVGNDVNAIHTKQDSKWTHASLGQYLAQCNFDLNAISDQWLSENFFEIRSRHILSTKVTCIVDYLRNPKFKQDLMHRLR